MDNRIQKAFDILKKDYRNKILLADLARKFNLSPFHFQRLFKKEMKETPAGCLQRIRLERAAHLIRVNADLSMSHIAKDCGFSSLAIFSRAFSNQFGTSPTAFSNKPATVVMTGPAAPLSVDIVQFPGAEIFYSHTSIFQPDLLDAFDSAASYCELEAIPYHAVKRYGVFTHLTFHGPKDRLNYYAGVELKEAPREKLRDRTFLVPAGQYATFATAASYHLIWDLMLQFSAEWLDKKPYLIRDLFGFEELSPGSKPSDYPNVPRRVYIPIRHKS